MPTNQTPLQRPRRLPLNHEQEMSLRYGELPHRPAFASEEERDATPGLRTAIVAATLQPRQAPGRLVGLRKPDSVPARSRLCGGDLVRGRAYWPRARSPSCWPVAERV